MFSIFGTTVPVATVHNLSYVNHDTLVNLTKENRDKLQFAFVANQTIEKLTSEDKGLYLKSLCFRIPLVLFLGAITSFSLKTKVYNKNIASALLIFGRYSVIDYMVSSQVNHVLTLRDLENNEFYLEKSKQYNFSVYDFHQAKREGYLKGLRDYLNALKLF